MWGVIVFDYWVVNMVILLIVFVLVFIILLFVFCLDYGLVLKLLFKIDLFSDKNLYYFISKVIEKLFGCELVYINMVICYGLWYFGSYCVKKMKELFEKISCFFLSNLMFCYNGFLFFWSILVDILNFVSKEMLVLGLEEMYFIVKCFFVRFFGVLNYGYFNINYSFVVIDKLRLS